MREQTVDIHQLPSIWRGPLQITVQYVESEQMKEYNVDCDKGRPTLECLADVFMLATKCTDVLFINPNELPFWITSFDSENGRITIKLKNPAEKLKIQSI